MIRMVDKDGDGQVSFAEFYSMATGGRLPPVDPNDDTMTRFSLKGGGGDVTMRGGEKEGAGLAPAILQQRLARRAALEELLRTPGINLDALRRTFKRFATAEGDSGSGLADYAELCEAFMMEPNPTLERLFQLYDTERSGSLPMRELLVALSTTMPSSAVTREDRLRFAVSLYDTAGNSLITRQDLTRILRGTHLAGGEREVARKVETIMAQADKDRDGVVSYEELAVVAAKFPGMMYPAAAQLGGGPPLVVGTGGGAGGGMGSPKAAGATARIMSPLAAGALNV